jgi:basic membrane protein A
VSFIRDPFAEVPKPADYASICSGDTRPLFFIGVDANQNYLGDTDNNPATLNHGLTSMLKRVDMATYEVIRSVVEGNFVGGIQTFGLENEGVGYALDEYNQALLSADLVAAVEAVKQDILAGTLEVPEER